MMLSRGHLRCSRSITSRTSNRRYLPNNAFICGQNDGIIAGVRWDDNNDDDGSSCFYSSLSNAATTVNFPINVINVNVRRTSHSTTAAVSSSSRFGTQLHPSIPSRNSVQNQLASFHPSSSLSSSSQHATNIQTRHSSSTTSSITEQLNSILPPTPEILTNATVWGVTGILLTNFHTHLHLPYWACISLTNICIRTSMIPIAIKGAKTSVKFGRISPEVQYLITNFTNDMKALRSRGMWGQDGSFVARQMISGQSQVINVTLQTLRGLFRLNKVNLLDIFKSPTLQIPIFWYFAVDLRKIIEGSDPLLAQKLVDSSFFWLTDLTEPDPWYGLPLATGALLYLNVEMAVGKQSLSGETSSKSNMAKILKDAFQTLAILMPCFMAQQPSGVQLYLATSMVFTLLQSNAMRNDAVRKIVGLPPVNTPQRNMADGEHVRDFFEKMAERQAAKAKGGYVLGEGVSVMGAQISVPRFGKKRKSSIVVEKGEVMEMDESKMIKVEFEVVDYSLKTGLLVFPDVFKTTPVPYLPGMAAPVFHTPQGSSRPTIEKEEEQQQLSSMPEIPLSVMEAANRGEKPAEEVKMAPKELLDRRLESKKMNRGPIDAGKLKSKWNRKKGKKKR